MFIIFIVLLILQLDQPAFHEGFFCAEIPPLDDFRQFGNVILFNSRSSATHLSNMTRAGFHLILIVTTYLADLN